jgi:hypothetical protein
MAARSNEPASRENALLISVVGKFTFFILKPIYAKAK